ncbi:MAG: hypothetical protein JXQ73_18955, partial [Phycisphaerae bacterium]|nr:hypothetical protein [Phycisphaerae bacterium]
MPRMLRNILIAVVAVLVPLSMVPPLLIAKARLTKSKDPRIQLVPDMDNQPKFKTQSRNGLFADHRAMRPLIEGTVARDQLHEDDALYRGKVGDKWVETFPVPVTAQRMRRGEQRYDV